MTGTRDGRCRFSIRPRRCSESRRSWRSRSRVRAHPMPALFHQLLFAAGIVSATVVIHLIGLDLLQVTLRWHLERFTGWVHLDRLVVPLGIVLGLFVAHGAEIWLY